MLCYVVTNIECGYSACGKAVGLFGAVRFLINQFPSRLFPQPSIATIAVQTIPIMPIIDVRKVDIAKISLT